MIRIRLKNVQGTEAEIRAVEVKIDDGTYEGVGKILDEGIRIAKADFRQKRAAIGKSEFGPRIGEHPPFNKSWRKTPVVKFQNRTAGSFYNDAPHANILDETGRDSDRMMPYRVAKKILQKESKLGKSRESYIDENGKKRTRKFVESRAINQFRRAAADKGQAPYEVMSSTRRQLAKSRAKREIVAAMKKRFKG